MSAADLGATSVEEAIVTVLRVHDAARDLERDEGFPGMFERDGSGEIAALKAMGYVIVPELALHPRTYSLTASGPNGELFLVTDDESGINIGHAQMIGGPLTAPLLAQHAAEGVA